MATIAKLVVDLEMNDNGFKKNIEDSASSLETWGKRLMGVGAVITGSIAAPIMLGSKAAWDQVDAVEQATIAMNAYADSSEQVDGVLSQLLDYARSDMGVLFSRQELFSAAQSMLMYGASIEHVGDYTEILSRSVGLGLSNWEDLNRVIGRVGSTGRLTGNDFDYLKAAGFDLDDSLRNTDITWQELMAHLDAGIPADALAGQADTIRGKTIRLQSALRGLGLAFLGVDSETSKFIEGGLGDTIFKGMSQLTELMKQAAPAVQRFGVWVGDAARKLSGLVDWFLDLPQPLKTALLLFTGISGVALTLGGAFMLVSAKVMGFMKVVSGLGGLTGVVKGLGTALRALTLTNPLFWLLAAAVAAFVAYRNNFMGFADAVNNFGSSVRNAFNRALKVIQQGQAIVRRFGTVWSNAFEAFRRNGENPVSAGFMAIRMALHDMSIRMGPLGGVIRGIGTAFGGVRHIVNDVIASFQFFRSAAESLVSAVGALFKGEWAEAFSHLKDAAVSAFDGFMTAYDTVFDLLADAGMWIVEAMGDVASTIGTWFQEQLSSVDWGGLFDTATSVLAGVGSWIAGKFGSAIEAISGWWSNNVGGVGWSDISQTALSALSGFGSWVVEQFGSAVESIQSWFNTQFEGVDFVAVAVTAAQDFGTALGGAIGNMVSIATDFYNWLANQIDSIDWTGIGNTIGEFLGMAIKLSIGQLVLAAEFFTHFVSELANVDWTSLAQSIWNYVKSALTATVNLLQGIAEGLYNELLFEVTGISWDDLGQWILDKIKEGAESAAVAVLEWFTTFGPQVYTAIGSLLDTLTSRGTEIVSGFYTGVTNRWPAVRQWFINLPTMIFNAIGSMAKTLWDRGTQALTGFYSAVVDKWTIGGVRSWFTGLAGRIVSAVGDLGSSLYNAGLAVMDGLWNGLKARWNDITSWLSGLNPANYKGPYRRDIKMLYEPGLWLMEGLSNGLEEGWRDVTRQLMGYEPQLNARAAGVLSPAFSTPRGVNSRPQVIDRSTHNEYFISLNDEQFASLLAARDKANIVHDAMTNRHSASQYGGGRR